MKVGRRGPADYEAIWPRDGRARACLDLCCLPSWSLLADTLRRVLIRDQADREAIASQLLRYRDWRGDDWAGVIDFLAMHPDTRRKVARLLRELEAWEDL